MAPLVGQRIADLVQSIDPNYVIDRDAEEQVLQLADDFLDKVTRQALLLCKHRGSDTLDVQDLQIVLAKHWGISVPGMGLPTVKPVRPSKAAITNSTLAAGTGGPAFTSKSGLGGGGAGATKRKSATSGEAPGGPVRKKVNAGGGTAAAPTLS